MSAAEKALGMIKAVLTYQERFDKLERNLCELSDRLTRLADSHANLRDRVSAIEGYLRGRSDQSAQPRLPNPGS
ncbi:MAG: hypothetical protein ABIT04_12840 [Novosphingobium sp.]